MTDRKPQLPKLRRRLSNPRKALSRQTTVNALEEPLVWSVVLSYPTPSQVVTNRAANLTSLLYLSSQDA
jgi:hypothetical protein